MARKKVGHVELQWTCPNCRGINPGPQKLCGNCGAAQPEDVTFEQAERQVLIEDEGVEEAIEAGADIHCPYCGTRNPASAEICKQCGGDLVEGRKREAGKVVGAYKTGPVIQISCPHCGAENPDSAKTCSQCGGSMVVDDYEVKAPSSVSRKPIASPKIPMVAIILVLLACGAIALFAFLAFRTEDVMGTVDGVQWERIIPIMALVPVSYNDWQDQIPSGADVGACQEEVRYVQDEWAPNSEEVCGTPYTVDTGTGYGEVVQDCEYFVYDLSCSFSVEEWSQVDAVSKSGNDFSPFWPDPVIEPSQLLGDQRSESYVINFETAEGSYTYTTSDYAEFRRAQIGTEWNLNISTFGEVVSFE